MVSWKQNNCKSCQIASHSLREKCPYSDYFLVRIQSKYGKIPTRKTPNTDTFEAVIVLDKHKANDIDIKFVIGLEKI